MEVPERRVRGVIQALVLMLWEHVWYQAIANVMRKRPENVACFYMTTGAQSQAFEADHGVAAPVCKPVISRADGANFVARGVGASGVGDSCAWSHDELVCGKHQLSRPACT